MKKITYITVLLLLMPFTWLWALFSLPYDKLIEKRYKTIIGENTASKRIKHKRFTINKK